MDRLSACLLPHSYAAEREIKRILSFFENLKICQPWHMGDHFPIPPERGLMRVRPPEHLRPVGDFPSLLSEYKSWMRQCGGRKYGSALAAIQRHGKGEDCTWDIRRSVRRPQSGKNDPVTDATQCHLLLHLARETEERLEEANEGLRVLRMKGNPVRDAVLEEETQGVLEGLPDFDIEREMDGESLRMILYAWNGLFGDLLDRDTALVTLSRAVFDCLSGSDSEHEEGMVRFCWPDLSCEDADGYDSKRERLAADETLVQFRSALIHSRLDTSRELSDQAKGLERSPLLERKEQFGFRMCFLQPSRSSTGNEYRSRLSGRRLFLLEESCHG